MEGLLWFWLGVCVGIILFFIAAMAFRLDRRMDAYADRLMQRATHEPDLDDEELDEDDGRTLTDEDLEAIRQAIWFDTPLRDPRTLQERTPAYLIANTHAEVSRGY